MKGLIFGLYLMKLLAFNKMDEFHMQIELFSVEELESDPFLNFSVKMERFMTEGL